MKRSLMAKKTKKYGLAVSSLWEAEFNVSEESSLAMMKKRISTKSRSTLMASIKASLSLEFTSAVTCRTRTDIVIKYQKHTSQDSTLTIS